MAPFARGRGGELRIARGDESLTPYVLEQFLAYYAPVPGWKIWQDAVIYKDLAGTTRNVLVRIGEQKRWGLAARISQESIVLARLLMCDADSPMLDLNVIVGCDIHKSICIHILDYLCSYASEWWECDPSMGALDVANKLGLKRLLSSVVRPHFRMRWRSTIL